jgi:predicted nucleic acid-binding protein
LGHPFVIGELALGHMRQRGAVLSSLAALPRTAVATEQEVLGIVERHALFGRGIGYVDVHLLAATLLTANARFWTSDRRLRVVAESLGLAATPPFDETASR